MTPTCTAPNCGRPSPDAFLCQPCTDILEQALAELPAWLSELEVTVTRQAKIASNGGKRSKVDGPLPFDWNASDLAWAAQNTVSTWARHIAVTRGVIDEDDPTPEQLRAWIRIASDPLLWLLGCLNSIRQDEAAGEIYDQITSLAGQIKRVVDRAEERWYAGPCHAPVVTASLIGETVVTQPAECSAQLYVAGLNGPIKCDGWGLNNEPGCGTVHDPDERREWLLRHVREHLLTLDELLPALPKLTGIEPNRGTVLKWARRGRLVVRSVNRYGVEMFLGDDVLILVRDEERRPGPKRREVSARDGRVGA